MLMLSTTQFVEGKTFPSFAAVNEAVEEAVEEAVDCLREAVSWKKSII